VGRRCSALSASSPRPLQTTVWKTLSTAHNLGKPKNKHTCIHEVIDPKSVTSNELYGYMTLAKEWKDGVISIIMCVHIELLLAVNYIGITVSPDCALFAGAA
jgi:hypothetical protein